LPLEFAEFPRNFAETKDEEDLGTFDGALLWLRSSHVSSSDSAESLAFDFAELNLIWATEEDFAEFPRKFAETKDEEEDLGSFDGALL